MFFRFYLYFCHVVLIELRLYFTQLSQAILLTQPKTERLLVAQDIIKQQKTIVIQILGYRNRTS